MVTLACSSLFGPGPTQLKINENGMLSFIFVSATTARSTQGVVGSLSLGPGGKLGQQEHSTEDWLDMAAYGYVMLCTHFHQCALYFCKCPCLNYCVQAVSRADKEICLQACMPVSWLSKLGKVHRKTLTYETCRKAATKPTAERKPSRLE